MNWIKLNHAEEAAHDKRMAVELNLEMKSARFPFARLDSEIFTGFSGKTSFIFLFVIKLHFSNFLPSKYSRGRSW